MTYGDYPDYDYTAASPGVSFPERPGRQKVRPGTLVGVSLWRLVVVVFAFTGFVSALSVIDSALPALSQQASLLAGCVYVGLLLYPLFTGGRRHEPNSPWIRGAVTVLLVLVGGAFLTLLSGNLEATWSLFEHFLTPLVLLIDWIAVGSNQANTRWWHPLSWLSLPLAYLVYYYASGQELYGFLDPGGSRFVVMIAGLLVALLAVGYLLYGIGRFRAAITLVGSRRGRIEG